MIIIRNRRCNIAKLAQQYPDAQICDLTSKSPDSTLVALSPFFPHGNIPIPGIPDVYAQSVEGIWQGLKVFAKSGIDLHCFNNKSMKNMKRTVRKYGMPLGHAQDLEQQKPLLDYAQARKQIYLPSYLWVLKNAYQAQAALKLLRNYLDAGYDLIFLDYNTNEDPDNLDKPLSHASLVKLYLEGHYPLAKNS